MKLSSTLLSAVAWTICTAGAFAQVTPANLQARSAGPTIFLKGPHGERSTLSYSATTGWHLRGRPSEQPLTVYLDGPTGFAFIYVQGEGWKFVGRIDDPGD